jgi:release factor glutamine methyltransferase
MPDAQQEIIQMSTAAIWRVLAEAEQRLRGAGLENARHEARWLLAAHLGLEPPELLARREQPIDSAAFFALLERRLRREPLAYLTGTQPFRGLELHVSPATLIPRADSETLIEAALTVLPSLSRPWRILDLGTGTGCLLIAVLREAPLAVGVGVDLSEDAAALARRNAALCGVADRAAFMAGDWAEAIAGRYDLILSNPPYIPSGDMSGLMPDVALYEPKRALDGGPDGLDAYRRILTALPRLLTPRGHAVLELGIGQAPAVSDLARKSRYLARTVPDHGGIERACILANAD